VLGDALQVVAGKAQAGMRILGIKMLGPSLSVRAERSDPNSTKLALCHSSRPT
jgi:predicted enzyme related to lactoylglutathione lyase